MLDPKEKTEVSALIVANLESLRKEIKILQQEHKILIEEMREVRIKSGMSVKKTLVRGLGNRNMGK